MKANVIDCNVIIHKEYIFIQQLVDKKIFNQILSYFIWNKNHKFILTNWIIQESCSDLIELQAGVLK